jgi:hypothetical protein
LSTNYFSFSNFFLNYLSENLLMIDNFWGNIKKLLNIVNKPDIWLIKEAELGKTAIVTGQARNTMPSADKAYRIAIALETTVEELVDGENGSMYIHKLISEQGALWEPPPRLTDIVNVLQVLDDATLETVKTMILSLQEKKGSERMAG